MRGLSVVEAKLSVLFSSSAISFSVWTSVGIVENISCDDSNIKTVRSPDNATWDAGTMTFSKIGSLRLVIDLDVPMIKRSIDENIALIFILFFFLSLKLCTSKILKVGQFFV